MIRWQETENRYGTPTAHDVAPTALTYGGKGPRWWSKVEGGKVFVGCQDA